VTTTAQRDSLEAPEPETPHKHRNPVLQFLGELPGLILMAFVLALLIKTFLVQAFFIPSGSMEPTLMPGDRVIVVKVPYYFHDPRRGDVIVFEDPDPSKQPDRGVIGGFFHWLDGWYTRQVNWALDRPTLIIGVSVVAATGANGSNGVSAGGVDAASGDCHPERVQHELCLEVVAHRPADDAAAEDILDNREEEEALPGLDVLQVADPEPVGLRAGEVTVDEIRSRDAFRVADRRPRPTPPAVSATDPELAHQSGDTLLTNPDPVTEPKLGEDPRGTVDLLRLAEDLLDPLGQVTVGELTRAGRPAPPGVEALTGDPNDAAQQGDGELCGLSLDEPEPRHGRSVSLAKKAAARFRISRS